MSRILKTGENQITQAYKAGTHTGIDLVKRTNQLDTIVAHSPGTVVFVQTGYGNDTGATGNASYGNLVKIRHTNGYFTLYAHLANVSVQTGAAVIKGQDIGYMGNSGNSYGAHLHFEVRDTADSWIDPAPYINADLPNLITNVEEEDMTEAEAKKIALAAYNEVNPTFDTISQLQNNASTKSFADYVQYLVDIGAIKGNGKTALGGIRLETLKALVINARKDDIENPLYENLEDIPSYWQEDVRTLLETGKIAGEGGKEINMKRDTLKAIIVANR